MFPHSIFAFLACLLFEIVAYLGKFCLIGILATHYIPQGLPRSPWQSFHEPLPGKVNLARLKHSNCRLKTNISFQVAVFLKSQSLQSLEIRKEKLAYTA